MHAINIYRQYNCKILLLPIRCSMPSIKVDNIKLLHALKNYLSWNKSQISYKTIIVFSVKMARSPTRTS